MQAVLRAVSQPEAIVCVCVCMRVRVCVRSSRSGIQQSTRTRKVNCLKDTAVCLVRSETDLRFSYIIIYVYIIVRGMSA